jgi:hypothetical protein
MAVFVFNQQEEFINNIFSSILFIKMGFHRCDVKKKYTFANKNE